MVLIDSVLITTFTELNIAKYISYKHAYHRAVHYFLGGQVIHNLTTQNNEAHVTRARFCLDVSRECEAV